MSLVGSLEDLGLGDILQIIGLSGKSGVLTLRSEQGEGRVVIRGGLIRSAWVKGAPTELCELLAVRAGLSEAELDAMREAARSAGRSFEDVVEEQAGLDGEQLDTLRREHIESTVLALFSWRSGEFSFELREPALEDERPDMALRNGGVNAQFLALEGARMLDESAHAESAPGAPPPDPATTSTPEPQTGTARSETESTPAPVASPVVVIEPDLWVLEWAKAALSESFPRVHIFQSTELGIARIRQYLARSEIPRVVLSLDAPPDPVSGPGGPHDIAARLRAQAPQMCIVFLRDAEVELPEELQGPSIEKPARDAGSGRRAQARRAELAEQLREALAGS